jgi:cytochrome c-type biogenesis protein CcmE
MTRRHLLGRPPTRRGRMRMAVIMIVVMMIGTMVVIVIMAV